jgi:prophage DNA circulation protein
MSADSLEIRVVKLESDVRRIDTTTQALVKLTEFAERNEVAIKVLIATSATKEELQRVNTDVQKGIAEMHKGIAEVHKEISAQGSRYTGWLLAVAGWMFVLSGLVVGAVRYLRP